jgi:hypothetical protein
MSLSTNPIMERLLSNLSTVDRDSTNNGMRKRVLTIVDVQASISTKDVEFKADKTPDGTDYLYANIKGMDVHLRDGLMPIGDTVTGRIEIKIRTWEKADGTGYRNYQFYLNCFPATKSPTCQIVFHDPEETRWARDIDGHNGVFAHVSSDRKRNHHLEVCGFNVETDAANRRPRRPVLTGTPREMEVYERCGTENLLNELDKRYNQL